jgi:hypothetical protein
MVHSVEKCNVDIAISIESHLNAEGANVCQSYVKSFTNCEFECAVPSALAAKMAVSDTPEDAEDDSDKGDHMAEDTRPATDGKRKHVGPAGIVMVMSPEMRARMRGRPTVSETGRLLHITLGDGATADRDRNPLHIIAVYGVSAVQHSDPHRMELAATLKKSLATILEKLKNQRVIEYAATSIR